MRDAFLACVGVLGAVALPACLLIGASAKPLIVFVYGGQWLAAVQPMFWLAVLGAMRIFFLFAYDYLVVLGRSRFLLAVQLVWLGFLLPSLVIGVKIGGLYGAGLAEAGVAAMTVLPCYVYGLTREGIPVGPLSRRLSLPTLGAITVGLVAMGSAQVAPSAIVALAISGTATAATVLMLGYQNRKTISMIRLSRTSSSPDSEQWVSKLTSSSNVTAEEIRKTPSEDAAARATLGGGSAFSRSNEVLSLPCLYADLAVTSPLYKITIASLNIDPARETAGCD
jgi:hypothetical protein